MKRILILLVVGIFSMSANAQKVAAYATGTPGEADYESLSFWTDNGERSFVTYTYGAERKEAAITYTGKSNFKGIDCFKIQFANKLVLYVMSNGPELQVANLKGDYLKTFKWEYEGPVNGIGTECHVCAKDANEAMGLLKSHYF